nr:MAG TPA: cellulose synthase operon protein [Caudoviricetes sp.]
MHCLSSVSLAGRAKIIIRVLLGDVAVWWRGTQGGYFSPPRFLVSIPIIILF